MSPPQVSLRAIAPTVYLPSLLYGIGQGAVAPIVVLSARELGASVAVASLIAALAGVGQVLGDLPAGRLAGRLGERRAMILAGALVSAALVLCLLANSVWILGIAILCTGMAGSVWGLARQSYLTEAVPFELRARALSTLGGVARIGMFIGPFLGAGVMQFLDTDGAYWIHLVAALAATTAVIFLPEVPRHAPTAAVYTGNVFREHLPVLRTLGLAALMVGAVRASRQIVIPLWADHLGLDPAAASLIFGLSGAVDMLLFYPAGKIMDRAGRSWVAVPCMLVLGLAHLVLPLTVGPVSLAAVALLMGIGNGMGSGIIMTLGADLSPSPGRAEFLGAWRLFGDTGNSAGPLVISIISTGASLGSAIVVMGGIGWLGAWAMARWIPRYHAPRVNK